MKTNVRILLFTIILSIQAQGIFANILVIQSDFGTRDSAVTEMKLVAHSVDRDLTILDGTHQIPRFNILEGAFRLFQAIYADHVGEVFVSIVDPGVGTQRRSVLAITKKGHRIITPDNGTLTFIQRWVGIDRVYVIDQEKWTHPKATSFTFHGRDLYVYVGALLASQKIKPEDLGTRVPVNTLKKISFHSPTVRGQKLFGTVVALDINFGNVWTDISAEAVKRVGLTPGKRYQVEIKQHGKTLFSKKIPFSPTFGHVKPGDHLLYWNSKGFLSCAENLGSLAERFGVESGVKTKITISK